jgi:hypothetical protein
LKLPGRQLRLSLRDPASVIIIDAMRQGYAGHYLNAIMAEGILVSVGLAALCLWIASRVFVRENA